MQRKWVMIAMGSCAVILLAVFVGMVVITLTYEPPLVPAPGYSGLWATEPHTFGASAAKSWAIFSEDRPCIYELLGWTKEDTLHVSETCDEQARTLSVDPRTGDTIVVTLDGIGQSLSGRTVAQLDAVELVRSPGTRPVSTEPETRAIKVRGDALESPDGRYVALIARYIYGPEDVLVVWPSDESR